MPNQFICKTVRHLFITATAVMLGSSLAQATSGKGQDSVDTIKPAEWTANLHPSIGANSAPIKIVFFIDYQCPSCRSNDPLVRKAVSKRSDVALIYRDFPLRMHALAIPAAIVAENARAHGTFERAHQSLMSGRVVTTESIKRAAREAGVSTSQTPQAAHRIELDGSLARKAKLHYVPCFIVIEGGKSTLMTHHQVLEFLK